jgi:2-iminobutanoate/2-iminopropanoate deaminase
MPKQVHAPAGTEPGSLPFSQLIEANGFVFVAGQVGGRPDTPGPVPGGIEAETRQMLENVRGLLDTVGLGLEDVVKATVYLVDFNEFARMNSVYREFFATDPPTRATVGVTRLAADYRVEIEVVATR